jgi:transcriptional regulator with XRE-family HTH domain
MVLTHAKREGSSDRPNEEVTDLSGAVIARVLRAIRERRGWSRETLADRSGVSWAAITQIESGRRVDPRLSTLSALAAALDVTVEQLTGRPAMTAAAAPLLEHRALLYADDTEFASAAVPFLTAGIERSHAVLTVTTECRIDLLRRALGRAAQRAEFRVSSEWYSAPDAALEGYRSFLQESTEAGAAWVRIIGEPVWADRSIAEIHAWTRYEATLNTSFAGQPATIVCPYDTESVRPRIVQAARDVHPEVVLAGDPQPRAR